MRLALSHPVKIDYFHLISGQDFPLRSNQVFDCFFEKQSVAGYMGFADTNNMEYRFMVYHFNDFFNLRKRGVINKILIKILSLLYESQLYLSKSGIQIRPTLNFELFKGSQWWSLRRDAIVYINNFLNTHPDYLKRFKYTSCCDEIFFHTIIMNSQYRNEIIRNNLRYIDWTDRGRGEGLPLVLIEDDFERIMTMENCFFARKIQPGISDELINMILSNG